MSAAKQPGGQNHRSVTERSLVQMLELEEIIKIK